MKKKVQISAFLIILTLVSVFFFVSIPEKKQTLILATTTSTYDSGLLDYLLPDFQEKYNTEVQIISVGTGQAIKNGERGDVDIILIHAPDAEKKFVNEGFGVNRSCVMYNDFIIIGPKNDQTGIKGKKVEDAFRIISEKQVEFISRGDDSGTYKKEKEIWNLTGTKPKGEWYKEVGAGMADTIRIANEKLAYTLTDRGTYLSLKDKIDLVPLVEGDSILLNPYSVIAINPKLNPNVDYAGAINFISWLVSEKTQQKIDSFRKYNEKLLVPLRGECIGD